MAARLLAAASGFSDGNIAAGAALRRIEVTAHGKRAAAGPGLNIAKPCAVGCAACAGARGSPAGVAKNWRDAETTTARDNAEHAHKRRMSAGPLSLEPKWLLTL